MEAPTWPPGNLVHSVSRREKSIINQINNQLCISVNTGEKVLYLLKFINNAWWKPKEITSVKEVWILYEPNYHTIR